ncbi:MAG: DUF86 domain-containing protein [Firmicutes bacterium]|nr:DUF86 domain-containing protein [Bacillota bacterium]
MVVPDVVASLLGSLRQYIKELQAEQNVSYEQFVADLHLRRFVEHTLQIAIQSCLDIAAHLIAEEGWREFADYRDAFTVLAENGVVPAEFLPTLHRMAQFRNLMVHQYARIEPEAVYGILTRGVEDLERYAAEIARWLTARGYTGCD